MSMRECPDCWANPFHQLKRVATSFAPGAAVVFGTNGMISCETAAQCKRVAEMQIELVTELLIPVTVGVILVVIVISRLLHRPRLL